MGSGPIQDLDVGMSVRPQKTARSQLRNPLDGWLALIAGDDALASSGSAHSLTIAANCANSNFNAKGTA